MYIKSIPSQTYFIPCIYFHYQCHDSISGDDDTGSIVSTSTSITESETSAHSKEITSK